ncbi:MAG: sensor histidine kinase, partial [Planctomycetota bacterium]
DLVARLQHSRQELEQNLREQEQHERLHSDFVRRILTELGAPLREILVAFQEAEASGDTRALLDVETAANELDERLTLLRGLDRQRDPGASSAIYHSVHLTAFCGRIVRLLEPAAKRCGVSISLQLDEQAQHQIFDGDLMSQCLISLLANAIKAPQCRNVILHIDQHGDELLFHVVDDGAGMPVELAQTLQRAIELGEIQLREPGFGLGLPLVLAQLAQMDGHLRLRRSDANGTAITISVPLPIRHHAQ